MNYQNFSQVFFEKVFRGGFKTSSLFQYFNFSPHLSRLRVQRYSFFTFPPNVDWLFLLLFCKFLSNVLIFRYVIKHHFATRFTSHTNTFTLIFTRIRTRARIFHLKFFFKIILKRYRYKKKRHQPPKISR